ncbi:unnamed protein product [Ambrosiozyma monospora]|uniref:Unnamed protein product n=1 Tax=Ambrosiozyma monospora TaxID=43982 RepID=A0A9W6T133_AMBMO|nr:unnamed protein product [Ambrosiozyma monospora]
MFLDAFGLWSGFRLPLTELGSTISTFRNLDSFLTERTKKKHGQVTRYDINSNINSACWKFGIRLKPIIPRQPNHHECLKTKLPSDDFQKFSIQKLCQRKLELFMANLQEVHVNV